MQIPEKVRILSGYESDDDFQPNDDALEKIMDAYAHALRVSSRANKSAVMDDSDKATKKAIWHGAVVDTLGKVLELYLHSSPERGSGAQEADILLLCELPPCVA